MPTPNYKDRFYRSIAQAVSTDSTHTYQASDIKAKTAKYVLEHYNSLSTEVERNEFIAWIKEDLESQINADIEAERELILREIPVGEDPNPLQENQLQRLQQQHDNFQQIINDPFLSDIEIIAQYQQMIFENDHTASIAEMWLTQEAMNINVMLVDKEEHTSNISNLNIETKQAGVFLHPGVGQGIKSGRQNVYYSNAEDHFELNYPNDSGLITRPFLSDYEEELQRETVGKIAAKNANDDLTSDEILPLYDVIPEIANVDEIDEDIVAIARAEVIASILIDESANFATDYENLRHADADHFSQILYEKLSAINDDEDTNFEYTDYAWLESLKGNSEVPEPDEALTTEQSKLNGVLLNALSRQYLLAKRAEILGLIDRFIDDKFGGNEDERNEFIINALRNFSAIKAQIIIDLQGSNYDVESSLLEQFIDENRFYIQNEIEKKEQVLLYAELRDSNEAVDIAILSEQSLKECIAFYYRNFGLPPETSVSQYKIRELSQKIRSQAIKEAVDNHINITTAWKNKFKQDFSHRYAHSPRQLITNFNQYLLQFCNESGIDINIQSADIQEFRRHILIDHIFSQPTPEGPNPPDEIPTAAVLSDYLTSEEILDLLRILSTENNINRNKAKILSYFSVNQHFVGRFAAAENDMVNFLIVPENLQLIRNRCTQALYSKAFKTLLTTSLTMQEIILLADVTQSEDSVEENLAKIIELLSKAVPFRSLFARDDQMERFLSEEANRTLIHTYCRAIHNSALERYLSSISIEALHELVEVENAHECAQYLRNSTGNDTAGRTFVETYLIVDDLSKPHQWRIPGTQITYEKKLNSNISLETVQEAAQRILTKKANPNRNPQLEIFLPYPYNHPHILQAVLNRREAMDPPLSPISDAQWKRLFNATTEEDIRKTLEEMKLIQEYSNSTSLYFTGGSDYHLVKDILKYRQVFASYDSIRNPSLARVFKQYYPDIELTHEQIKEINRFLNDPANSRIDFLVSKQRNEFLNAITTNLDIPMLPGPGLHIYLQEAAAEIAYDHINYLRVQEASAAERHAIKQQIRVARDTAEKQLQKRADQIESQHRLDDTKTKAEILTTINNPDPNDETHHAELEVTNRLVAHALVMERMADLLLSKQSISPNIMENVESITRQWLVFIQHFSFDEAIEEFNTYMHDEYQVPIYPSFITPTDVSILENGYTLETALLSGKLEEHIENLTQRMEDKLGAYTPKSWWGLKGATYNVGWEKALEETRRLYNTDKVKGVDSYEAELAKLRNATLIGGGKESFTFAAQEAKRVRIHQEHFEQLLRLMEAEEEVIETLKKERDECKAKYSAQIASTSGTQAAFDALSQQITDLERISKQHRTDYETYKRWNEELKEIRFNIERTLEVEKGRPRDKLRPLVLERSHDDKGYHTLPKREWNAQERLFNPLGAGVASAPTTVGHTLYTIGDSMPIQDGTKQKYTADIAPDEVRVKIRETKKKSGSGLANVREYDKGKCTIVGEWVSPILRATYKNPDNSDQNFTKDSPNEARYFPLEKQYKVNRGDEAAPDWVPLTITQMEPLQFKAPARATAAVNEAVQDHRKILAQQCFDAVTEMLIKGYLNQKQYMPNKADPMRLTAYEPLAAEYLMAACRFYQALFPDLLTKDSFVFLGVQPEAGVDPACNLTDSWGWAIDNKSKEEDKAYINFDKSPPSMQEFLRHLGYTQPADHKTNHPTPLRDCGAGVIIEALKDCKEAILRAEEMKRVRMAEADGEKTKAMTENKTAQLWRARPTKAPRADEVLRAPPRISH